MAYSYSLKSLVFGHGFVMTLQSNRSEHDSALCEALLAYWHCRKILRRVLRACAT